jgi:hypothetical protein
MIETYEDYKKLFSLETVDVGSKLQLLKQIKILQRKKCRTEKGFNGMKKKTLIAIHKKLI